MSYQYTLRPDKRAFVVFPIVKMLLVMVIPLLIAITLLFIVPPFGTVIGGVIILICLAILGAQILFTTIRFNKEHYVFQEEKVINTTGSLFSDSETGLIYRNITHVKLVLPWLEHKLFGTGTISIEAAGSDVSEIRLRHIEKPEEFYEYVKKMMRHNGFSLKSTKLLEDATPHPVAVMLETLGHAVGGVIAALFILVNMVAAMAGLLSKYPLAALGLAVLVIIVLIPLIAKLILFYLDLKRRVYRVYEDMVSYSEGFLTKHEAFMPAENITDAQTFQGPISRIFDLHDIKISCQGTQHEILFKNIGNAESMERHIDSIADSKLTEKKQPTTAWHKTQEPTIEKKGLSAAATLRSHEYEFERDTDYTATLKADPKAIQSSILVMLAFGIIIFPLFPIMILGIIALSIASSCSTFTIKKQSVESLFDFIVKSRTEFSARNVTSIKVHRSFIDQWHDTCTVSMTSIGAGKPMIFFYIKDEHLAPLLEKFGITEEKSLYHIPCKFSFGTMIKRNLITSALVLLLLVGLGIAGIMVHPALFIPAVMILLLIGLPTWYAHAFYNRAGVDLNRTHIHYNAGFFWKYIDQYARYPNIKNITVTKYPFDTQGTIAFNIAGEMVTKDKNGNVHRHSESCKVNYIEDAPTFRDMLNTLLDSPLTSAQIKQRLQASIQQPLRSLKPSVKNALTPLIIIAAIVAIFGSPLFLTLPITAIVTGVFFVMIGGLVVFSLRVRNYLLYNDRIATESGIIYRKYASVPFSRIDHIGSNQGFLGKMFGNGTITINTTGSSGVEMTLKYLKDHKRLYDEISAKY